VRTSDANWRKPLQWNKAKWEQCRICGWRGPVSETHDFCPNCDAEGEDLQPTRQRVFCASLADVFEDNEQVAGWRSELFNLILATPQLDWLLLTKRPENIIPALRNIPALKRDNVWDHLWLKGWFPNVWLGTSVEDQAAADKRIPDLLAVPATVRFLSCEPLLGPVDLGWYLIPHFAADDPRHYPWRNGVEWVICGGESGPQTRGPMHPDWPRSLRDQCQAAEVPFFFKQWGQFVPAGQTEQPWYNSGEIMYAADKETPVQAIRLRSKHDAGRQLDGREWNEIPGVWR
jgi:protein gp37